MTTETNDSVQYLKEELEQTKKTLHAFLEASSDGYWDWYIQDDYQYMSPRFWEILGYDYKGKKHHPSEWKKTILDEDLEKVMANYDTHVKTKGKHPYYLEVRFWHKDGSIVELICRGKVVEWTEDNEPIRMIGTHTDITEIKKSNQALLSASKFKALGEMAASIAHEINNPLAVISLHAQKMKILIRKNTITNDSILEFSDTINKTVLRITKIIKGLRSLSRSGDNDPFEYATLSEIIEDTLSICEEKLKNNEINLVIDNPDKSLSISCRKVQISQVLLNLINNSVDAIEALDEKWVTINIYQTKTHAIIAITDSGLGIPPDIAEKITLPFYSTKPTVQGMGIGLSISKAILDEHNASITYDSNSPNTKFVVEIPMNFKQDLN